MKKFFTLLLICLATMVAKAQFPQTLPIDYHSFFAVSAINGVALEKDAYTSTTQDGTNPIKANQWNLSGKTAEATSGSLSPVVNTENYLSYSDYVDNMAGPKVVVPGLAASSSTIRTSVYSLTEGSLYTGKAFYLSVLVSFSGAPATANDFLCFDSNYTGNSQRGRVFVKFVDPGIQIGLGWSSAATTYSTTLGLKQTHLLVMKIIPAATGNETCALWINPVIGATEEASSASLVETMVVPAALLKIRGIVFRQRPEIVVEYAGLRFSDNWADVVKKSGSSSVSDLSQGKSSFKIYPTSVSNIINFEYSLLQRTNTQLDVYSSTGQFVKALVNNKDQAAGSYSKSVDVSDLKSGIYFARFTTGSFSETTKLIVTK